MGIDYFRFNAEFSLRPHRLQRVLNQIEEHPPKFERVDRDLERRGEALSERNLLRHSRRRGQQESRLNGFSEVHPFKTEERHSRINQKFRDESVQMMDLCDQAPAQRLKLSLPGAARLLLRLVRSNPFHFSTEQFTQDLNGCQRISDLMGHPSGELSEKRHLPLESNFFLEVLHLSKIGENCRGTGLLSAMIFNRRGHRTDPALPPGGIFDREFLPGG